MKQLSLSVAMVAVFALLINACGNSDRSKAIAHADQIKSAVKTNRPGTVATTASGYTMTATLNGDHWEASSMMPPEPAGRIVGYVADEYMGLPYDNRDIVLGKKQELGPDNAVDINFEDLPGLWFTTTGQIEITRVSDGWAEGKFSVTLKSAQDNKSVNITDGFFRIPLPAEKGL